MKYAESLLLGGQLISADEVDKDTYSELLPVCPHSRKKVKLVSYPAPAHFKGAKDSKIFTWVHSEKISIPESSECNEMNKYYGSQRYGFKDIARVNRLNLFKPNLWELILSSAILDNPQGYLDNYDSDEDRLMMWFDQHFKTLCRNPLYQARIKQECNNLYDNCIKKTIEDSNNQLFEKVAEMYSSHNHIVYGQQIASEVLEYVLATWDLGNISKLIYLAVNEEVCQAARKFSYVMSGTVKGLLKPAKATQFMDLWVQDKYSGMNKILEAVRRFPELTETYKSGLATIDVMFTINLCLIFSCIPWIDELKKINQESNPTNPC